MLYTLQTNALDATYNLALEQALFERLAPREDALWYWQNARAVIVGRHQNTAEEVRLDVAQALDTQVVRRPSGGGAVYHDLGNVNFTYITDLPQDGRYDLRALTAPVLEALAALGVQGEVFGRNDLCIAGAKFSGNAQLIQKGRVLHHGTLLFDTDLAPLGQLLTPAKEKLSGHGVRSVSSRVTNIRPHLPKNLDTAGFLARLRATLQERLSPAKLPPEMEASLRDRAMQLQRERYQSADWNVGASPFYTRRSTLRFPGGTVTAYMAEAQGLLQSLALRGDFFSREPVSLLEQALCGQPLKREALLSTVRPLPVDRCILGLTAEALVELLLGESQARG